MKLLKTEITPFINEFVYIEMREQSFFSSPFLSQQSLHAHPELQLTFIINGFGKRIIGNTVEPFEPGDMVLVGSNLPHIWISNSAFYKKDSKLESKLIIAYINPKALNQLIDSFREFENIREMVFQSEKGICILGATKNMIAEKLQSLTIKQGYDKIEGILNIMHLISISKEKKYIVTDHPSPVKHEEEDKLIDVIKYIQDNFHEKISLKEVADIACMTQQSFCRFFKKRTKMSLSQYLNCSRINKACDMLLQTNLSIADIAYRCGYNSVAHFCKNFKQQVSITAFQYRQNALQEIAHEPHSRNKTP